MDIVQAATCVICGANSFMAEGLGAQMMELTGNSDEVDDIKALIKYCDISQGAGHETWSPLTEVGMNKFQRDIAAIGPFEKDQYQNQSGRDLSDAALASKVICLTGFKHHVFGGDAVTLIRNKDKKSWLIPTDESIPDDFEEGVSTWESSGPCRIAVRAVERGFLVHRQCIELVQSISNREGKGKLTMRSFWLGALKYKDLFIQASYGISPQDYDNKPWLQYGGCRNYNITCWISQINNRWLAQDLEGSKKVRKYDKNLRLRITKALQESLNTGKVDKAIREEFWKRIDAWEFFPLDDFPLDAAFSESCITKGFEQLKIDTSSEANSTIFDKLPTEIVGEIVSFLDLGTALNFALTCNSLSSAVLPLMNKAALFTIWRDYPWMLPSTPTEKREWKQELIEKHGNKSVAWLCYMQQCLKDPWSMKNRRRVWINANSIYKDILDRGLLE